jgi:N-acetylmuramoyl-L-alanine amidase
MRPWDYIAIHCSATPPDMDIGVDEIREWHIDRGWSDVGYHYVIRRDGTIEKGRDEDVIGAHVKGFNGVSLGICMVGGVSERNKPDANYTASQWRSLKVLVDDLKVKYPEAKVQGHRDYPDVSKSCPCFDVIAWYGE